MSFLELAKARKSIRAFQPDPISQEDLMTLLEAARYAPSAGNCQPWRFLVVRDKGIAAQLRAVSLDQETLTTAAALIVICADLPRATAKYGERGETLYCIQDTAAAAQNILLCARDIGLGGCWIGAFDPAATKQILGLGDDLRPTAILAIGKPAVDPNPRRRREIDEIATFIGA